MQEGPAKGRVHMLLSMTASYLVISGPVRFPMQTVWRSTPILTCVLALNQAPQCHPMQPLRVALGVVP
jgi:hypothetical protein